MNTTLTLAERIALEIRTSGPLSVANYMSLCLTHPDKGYYKGRDPLGAAGDFITAPEISQMFGEMTGFFLVNLWQQMGEPKNFTLLELGPGRGTWMADMLRVACRAPGFRDGLRLRLFETSPALIARQKTALDAYDPQWLENFDTIPDGPVLIVANEFFDALPIRQFMRKSDGWHERQIGLVADKPAFGLSPTAIAPEAMPEAVADAAPDTVFEICFAAGVLMARLAKIVAAQGGALLIIDYGYPAARTGETLQGVRNHAFADVLAHPGQTDLSAHVDFGTLADSAAQAGLTIAPLTPQGRFLTNLGIAERARALAAANPDAAETVRAAHARLVDADQMGEIFKVFCAHSPGLAPVGLSPDSVADPSP